MVDSFQIKLDENDTSKHPSGDGLFSEGTGKPSDQKEKEQLHTTAAKGSCISKRARPDMQLTVAVSCARAQNPNGSDPDKLAKLLKFLNGARNKKS